MTNSLTEPAADKSQTEAGISNSSFVSEAEMAIAVADSAAVKSQNSREQIPAERKQTEADVSTSVRAFPTQGRSHDRVSAVCPERLVPAERKQAEADISTLVSIIPPEGQVHDTVSAVHPERLILAERKQTEADVSTSLPTFPNQGHLHHTPNAVRFEQLDIGYVLAQPCPSISLNQETSLYEKVKEKAAVQRWIDDDYMCRHNILNSLCDNLFQLYSQKSCSARKLWEELKLVYDEDLGTTRSQINKYIHFQMVDGVSVIEQVQELHRIANSIMTSGTWIDENFHVEMNYKKGLIIEPKLDYRLGMRRKENKRVCYGCGKEGHIIKNCPDRKFEAGDKSNEKGNRVLSPNTDNKVADIANTK
ncbi:UNVERIFIED_CONTAM: hypothetical protein Sangu_0002700 [Sesamum angustifolium]|uniref:CCHC-type domain-containing protein n=1 Tax=Sesamum angustifolium TaxID=2727405 RepID=A0AAW2RH26_9LAMI